MRVTFALWLALCVPACADSVAQAPLLPPVVSYVQLGSLQTAVGATAFVTDCRAIASVSALALLTQLSGQGKGCLATYNGTGWMIDGTTIPVAK